MNTNPTPVSERIVSLDIIRGVAVLGILVMNIQHFSMISAAYLNPTAYGNFTGLNKIAWYFSHIFAEMKFWSLFSILFGAGIILFTERLKNKGIHSLKIHYRRVLWLLLIGLAHAYLLWHGDILVAYAVSALWVVLLRNTKPVNLVIIGTVLLAVVSFLYFISGLSMSVWPEENKAEMLQSWLPDLEHIHNELNIYRGSWMEQMEHRSKTSLMMQTTVFFFQVGWRTGGLMLIGMALYKWGILSAEKTSGFYSKLALAGLIPGIALVVFGIVKNLQHNFSMDYSFFIGSQYNYWGSVFISLGYVGIIVLCIKSRFLKRLKSSLQAVGRMAFTNYLVQTIICTILFYGHGFGLFGKLDRPQQFLVVAVVWALQMLYSPLWLKHYNYGPFEWFWRNLTYGKFQSMKK